MTILGAGYIKYFRVVVILTRVTFLFVSVLLVFESILYQILHASLLSPILLYQQLSRQPKLQKTFVSWTGFCLLILSFSDGDSFIMFVAITRYGCSLLCWKPLCLGREKFFKENHKFRLTSYYARAIIASIRSYYRCDNNEALRR